MVSGFISGDVTWNEMAGTVYRTPGFGITSGGSLTIEHGIVVAVEPDENIYVQGKLLAHVASPSPAPIPWMGGATSECIVEMDNGCDSKKMPR